jgi:hypothetical protein
MSEGGQNLSSSHSVSSNTHVTNELHNLNGVSNYSPFQARRVTNRATPSVGGENPDPTPTDSFSAPKNQNNNNNNNNVNSDDADELNASACMASSLSSSPSVQSSASSTSSDTSQPKSISCIESETVDSESNADFYFESKEENESCIFTPVSVQTLDINDFECSLCYKLFYQPVTTVCGMETGFVFLSFLVLSFARSLSSPLLPSPLLSLFLSSVDDTFEKQVTPIVRVVCYLHFNTVLIVLFVVTNSSITLKTLTTPSTLVCAIVFVSL